MKLLTPKRKSEPVDPNPSLERGEQEDCLATFWHQATPGTTFWRCLVPARHLPAQTLPFGVGDLKETKDGTPYLPRQKGDTAIWQFLGDEQRTRVAMGIREVHNYRTLMELDDNYTRAAPYQYGSKKKTPWALTRDEAKGGYSHEMHRACVPWMDGLIVSTDFLADLYDDYNANIWVCPNSVDPVDWQYDREEHDAFRIVYYGSPSHITDTPLVTDALKWASKQPGVEVWTVGFKNPAWSFPYQIVPWGNDLVEARKHLFRFDLGIAPLKTNDWSNAKSDVKALEYAMAGVMPVVQKSEPFKAWDGVVPTPSSKSDWTEAIRWAVKNPDEVTAFAQRAKDYVMEKRTIQSNIHLWREAVNG